MHKLVRLLLSLVAGVLALAPASTQPRPESVRQVFLVQNSGWMEPFYLDSGSPLRPFLKKLIGKANLANVDMVVASFNQDGQVEGRTSPEILFEGAYDPVKVAAAIDGIDLPRKASGAYADADFRGALSGTISRILKGQQGVIWLVTNNKDAPDNNPAVLENTRAFYRALRESPYITSIAAFPMRKVVTGPHFSEKGLIVYAIAYGERGKAALAAILRDGSPVRSLFPAPPVKLKPLNQDPVELLLSSATARVTAEVRNGRLDISGVSGGTSSAVLLEGVLRNTYYPQNIASARLIANWRSGAPELAGTKVEITPGEIANIPAYGKSGRVRMELRLPAVPRRPGLAGLFEDERIVTGEIEVRLEHLSFSLAPDFLERVAAISGGDTIRTEQAEAAVAAHLPEVFLDYRRITTATMKVPVRISVHFSPWPLILLIALLILLLALAIFFGIVMARPRSYLVRVGQIEQRVALKPREVRTVADDFGTRAEVRGRLFGPPSVRVVEPVG